MRAHWLGQLINIIFPASCVACKLPSQRAMSLCLACEHDLPKIQMACPICRMPNEDNNLCASCYYHAPPYDRMICPYYYRDPLPQFIQKLKFSSQLIYARMLGELLLQEVRSQTSSLPDCLIPMPLHPQRIRERGFNQSIEIARMLSRRLAIPIQANQVKRTKATDPQTKTPSKKRHENVKDAFEMTGSLPKHVAIIDDVVTTGATVGALVACLKKAGVQKVEVWCCARTVLD